MARKERYKKHFEFKKTEFIEKYFPYVKIGYDKEGSFVRYFDVGNMDVTGVLSSLTVKDVEKLMYYETEADTEDLKNQSKKFGRNIDSGIFIYNYENFSLAKATDKKAVYLTMTLSNMLMNEYPERIKHVFILNASMYFFLLFAVVKTLFTKTTLDKFHLYSDDSYKEDLLKLIDADVLPAFLGGNRTDPDGNPLCLTFVKRGEIVPNSYYLSEKKQALAKAPDVEKITLSNASFHEVNIEVVRQGSYLEWEFETKCRDIGFGLFYKEMIDGEVKNAEIVPIQRIDTEVYPETGTFKCDKAGTYVIVFDNTYSWIRAKEIYYRIRVVTGKEHELAQEMDEITL